MPSLRSVACVALLTVLVVAVDAAPVAAEPSAGDRIGGADGGDQGDFQMPFACGQVWGASTHSDHPAVDWNGVGPAAGANDHGHPVLAGLAGTVAAGGYQAGYGARVVVDHGDGWSSLYAAFAR